MPNELTTLQRKAIHHAIIALERSSKYDIIMEIVDAVAPAMNMDDDQRSKLYTIAQKIIQDANDGKDEAKSWLGAILKD